MSNRKSFHLFLLVGQSNMAGRGKVEKEDGIPHPRVLTLAENSKWMPAIDPIHFDKPCAGVGLGRTFGVTLAEEDNSVTVGLIPCAAGGSPISVWRPGQLWEQTHSHPYDETITRSKRAMKDGVLKGILWHQGESDCNSELANDYEANLQDLISRLRGDLGAPGVPFIIGQLGQFPGNPWSPSTLLVNEAHISIVKKVRATGFVSSSGLTSLDDNTHFDAASQREFGRRYARVYEQIAEQSGRGDA